MSSPIDTLQAVNPAAATALTRERLDMLQRIAELETELGAWHKTFGTTQLTHAHAQVATLTALLRRASGLMQTRVITMTAKASADMEELLAEIREAVGDE